MKECYFGIARLTYLEGLQALTHLNVNKCAYTPVIKVCPLATCAVHALWHEPFMCCLLA